MERAERLRQTVEDQVGEVLDGAAVGGDIYVGWVAAVDAASCPARYRASGADGWGFPGWSAPLAGGAVGRAALAEHLRVTAPGPPGLESGGAAPLPQPVEAVRAWLRLASRAPTSSVAEWIAERHEAGDRATLAATAAVASRWLAGFVRVVGWPLPERLALVVDDPEGPHTRRWSRRWRPRLRIGRAPAGVAPTRTAPAEADVPGGTAPAGGGAGPGDGPRVRVAVASSPDAVVGKVTPAGDFDLVVHRPFSPGEGALADRAAFEAVAGALASGIVARHVVVTTADTSERARCPADEALIARGAALVVEVVRQRAVAAGDAWGFDDATPSAGCRHCPERERCPAGQAWLAGPGRWRGGLPAVSVTVDV